MSRLPQYRRTNGSFQAAEFNNTMDKLEGTKFRQIDRYETWETGITCGVDGHDNDCLCDVNITTPTVIPDDIGERGTVRLAWLATNGGNTFVDGEFVEFLERIAIYDGVVIDFLKAGKHAALVPAPVTVMTADSHARARVYEMANDGADWSYIRQWLCVHGLDRETRVWSRRLNQVIARRRAAQRKVTDDCES